MKILIAILLAITLTGCGPKQQGGTVIGAAFGGLLGNQFGGGSGNAIATTAGVFIGGLLGNSIGADLDKYDAALAGNSFQRALENNRQVDWRSQQSGNQGRFTTLRTVNRGGTYCREYQSEVVIHGRFERAWGTACRMNDGTWQIQ